MPFQIDISSDEKNLVVRHYGVVTVDEFESVTSAIEERVEETRELGMLVDLRDVDVYPEKADFVLWLRNRTPRPPVVRKVAMIPNPRNAATVEFMVLASLNEGIQMRSCSDMADAIEYLSQTP